MKPLDLGDFELRTIVRPLTLDDFDELVAMAALCFPGMEPWTREEFASQLRIFP